MFKLFYRDTLLFTCSSIMLIKYHKNENVERYIIFDEVLKVFFGELGRDQSYMLRTNQNVLTLIIEKLRL